MTIESPDPHSQIVPAKKWHALQMLTAGLRAVEVRELEAAGLDVEAAVFESLETSTKAWTLTARDRAVAMWGVCPRSGYEGVGALWLFSTEEFPRHSRAAQCVVDAHIREMGEQFPILSGYLDIRRTDVISWLKRAGFRFDTAVTRVGPQQSPFLQFGKRV